MARLSIPTGCCWDVRVKREDGGTIWLHDGFLEFMEDNSIGIEYFLIFKHEGNSKFVVHIFDLTATEIMYNYISDLERGNVVNEIVMDEIRECRDDSFNYESNYNDSDEAGFGSFKDESGDKDSDNRTDDSMKNEIVYEVFDDDLDDSFKYESLDEEANENDDDYFINESGDKGNDNGRVESYKYESDDKDTDDSSVEYLGSTTDHRLSQVFAEPSEVSSKGKQNAGVPRQTTRSGRCYLTRKKRQIIEGHIDTTVIHKTGASSATNQSVIKANQSRNDGSNISPSDIPKDLRTRAKMMQPMVPNSFRVSMRPYHITKGCLRVPSAFAMSHMCFSKRLIKLVDADNKEWEVLYLHRDLHSNFLSKGWLRFVQDNGLMAGDICVFERMGSNKEVKLKVNII
ncbi:hypothetical protein Leryth_011572 [Lithospermum erythrorhizon]|nr:hypothetical protein Leryth_011572 [Lithospermum erythrorhizon]